MSNSKNQELYPFLEEADRVGYITWTKSTPESEKKIIRRGISLGFLDQENNNTARLSETGQKVVDANGDFSVIEEKPSVSVVADQGSNVIVGENSGHINQSSVNERTNIENNTPSTKPNRTQTIMAVLAVIIAIIAIGVMIYLDYN